MCLHLYLYLCLCLSQDQFKIPEDEAGLSIMFFNPEKVRQLYSFGRLPLLVYLNLSSPLSPPLSFPPRLDT